MTARPHALALLLVTLGACANEPAHETRPAPSSTASVPDACRSPSMPQTGLRNAVVEIATDDGPVRFDVELAETDRQRMIGMMCRTEMGPTEGMLFIFPDERPRSFWMKNTLLPLDMLFLDRDGRVVGVVERAEPLTLDSRAVAEPARYVLELLGGAARTHGLRAGQWARFEGITPSSEGR